MEEPRRLHRRLLQVVASSAVVVLASPLGAAASEAPLPGASSAIRQYIEMVPTASGSVASGGGEGKAAIPAPTKQQIEKHAGRDAELLTDVVSSEAYGAPAQFQAPPPSASTQTPATEKQPPQPTPRIPKQKPEPAPTTPIVLAAAPLPDTPNPASAAFGTVGLAGVLFALGMAGALGFAVLPRLTRR